MKNVVYLVTGAAGHLGLAVVKKLLECGAKVRALVLKGDKAAANIPSDAEVCFGNILNKENLQHFFRRDTGEDLRVIHCAGIVSTSSVPARVVHDVNVNGTKNIIEQCRSSQAEKLVYVSSVHALPVLPAGNVMTEDTVIDSSLVHGPYAKTKAEATAAVFKAAEEGLNTAVVFPGGIIGPEDYGCGYMTQMFTDYLAGRMKCGIRGGFDFVDVRDAAAGIVTAAGGVPDGAAVTAAGGVPDGAAVTAAGAQTVSAAQTVQSPQTAAEGRSQTSAEARRYLLTNRWISIRELFDIMHRVTGFKKTKLFFHPLFARLAVPVCALYYRIRRQKPLFNAYSIHTLTCNSQYSHKKADIELGYTTRPIEQTIRDTIENLISADGRLALRGIAHKQKARPGQAALAAVKEHSFC